MPIRTPPIPAICPYWPAAARLTSRGPCVLSPDRDSCGQAAHFKSDRLLEEEIAAATQAYPDMRWECANAESLRFPNGFFDLGLLFSVFSSILDTQTATHLAKEGRRVMGSCGAILWYDLRYDNPANPHVQGVARRRIRSLFPEFELRLGSITLLPHLAPRLGWVTPALYSILAAFPPLRTPYLGLLRNAGRVDPPRSGHSSIAPR